MKLKHLQNIVHVTVKANSLVQQVENGIMINVMRV